MAIRVLSFQAAPGDPAIQYTAQDDRTLVDALVIGTGISYQTDLAVVQRAAGANFSVDVGAGHAVVAGTSVADQGKYVVQNDATANLAITAGGSTTARYDLVYLRVRDKPADGGANYDGVIDKITGTVGAGVPTLAGAGIASAIPLAEIGPIVTSTASITTSLINDVRDRAYPLGAARGELAYAERLTADATTGSGSSGLTDIASLSITFRLAATRRVVLVGSAILNSSVATDTGKLFVASGAGAAQASAEFTFNSVTNDVRFEVHVRKQLAAGTYTYKLQRQRVQGTGLIRCNAASTDPAWIGAYDVAYL